MIRNLKLNKKAAAILLAASMSCGLVGCGETEMSSPNIYDTIDTNTDSDSLTNGHRQVKSVDGEDFDLVIDYKCDLENEENWTITSDKKLTMEIKTENLPKDYKVYIDNIHTDTSIIASNSAFNGVLQDTMDDRIHNSLMLGFPINDDFGYNGKNEIEGQNETFIQGTVYAYNGYGSGSIEEKRRTESDYLEHGVYGNKISSIIDLLIHTPEMEEGEYKAVSVSSDIVIKCCNYVRIQKDNGDIYYKVYTIDENGEVTDKDTKENPNKKAKSFTK